MSDARCLSVRGRGAEDSGAVFSPPPEQCFMSPKGEDATQFPSPVFLPVTAVVLSRPIYLRAIFLSAIKPLRTCRWLCTRPHVVCESVEEPGSAGVRRWFCIPDRAGVRMRLLNMHVRVRERMCFAENKTARVRTRRCSYETGCACQRGRKRKVLLTAFLYVFDEYHKF